MGKQPSSRLGELYLGAPLEPDSKTMADEPFYYRSKDLVTHGVCIGMTGSGKTGLCIALLEEMALAGIPAILIDPKGDLANLKLLFDGLSAEEFEPWVSAAAAESRGLSRADYAAQQADLWRKGLADWGLGAADIARLKSKVEITVYTPGSSAGVSLDVLHSFDPPENIGSLDDELIREEIAGLVSALLGMLGSNAGQQDREHILLATLLEQRWRAGEPTTLRDLISLIQAPPFKVLGAMDLESFFPESERRKLAFGLNGLIASPSFQSWLTGEPLAIETLLHDPITGKPRLGIVNIAHLNDSERMFFVALLLNQWVAWMRRQEGTEQVRALLYFDEIAGYLPPHPANPPSKQLLMTVLKQGRAFGASCMLVTQNPVDLDYKALSNCGTWFLGRLQTERDKARVLDGLQGASGEAGGSTDRKQLDTLLSALGQRVFLLHNVHADGPRVFHSRWVMSYLAGPMTRGQIRALQPKPPAAPGKNPGTLQDFLGETDAESEGDLLNVPPAPPRGLSALFQREPGTLAASLFFKASVTYRDRPGGESIVHPIFRVLHVSAASWEESVDSEESAWASTPPQGAKFRELPPIASDINTLKILGSAIADYVAAAHPLEVEEVPGLKLRASVTESTEIFRERLNKAAEEWKAERLARLEAAHTTAVGRLENSIAKARETVEREGDRVATYKRQETVSTLSSVGTAILSILGGRKSGMTRAGSVLRGASGRRATTERAALALRKAEQNLERLEAERDGMRARHEQASAELDLELEALIAAKQTVRIAPLKSHVRTESFGLVWMAEE